MDLSTLKYAPGSRKDRMRVGRGPSSGKGKTSGRGHKGQKARSGYAQRGGFEGGQMPLHRRIPKRGFHHRRRFPVTRVNLDVLEGAFEAGASVTPESLVQAGLVEPTKGGIKILARGEITKALNVHAHEISAQARAKIEAAGGTVEIFGVPVNAMPPQEDR